MSKIYQKNILPFKTSAKRKFGGFTLIELLVVVLIIGILAAIALPQYEKAVEKSRASQALTIIKSFLNAQHLYYMANGTYTDSLDDLDISMPWTGTKQWFQGVPAQSNGEWSLQTNSHFYAVYVGRISGPYKGGGFMAAYKGNSQLPQANKNYCVERTSGGVVYEGEAGSYCEKVMGAKFSNNQDLGRAYLMP